MQYSTVESRHSSLHITIVWRGKLSYRIELVLSCVSRLQLIQGFGYSVHPGSGHGIGKDGPGYDGIRVNCLCSGNIITLWWNKRSMSHFVQRRFGRKQECWVVCQGPRNSILSKPHQFEGRSILPPLLCRYMTQWLLILSINGQRVLCTCTWQNKGPYCSVYHLPIIFMNPACSMFNAY